MKYPTLKFVSKKEMQNEVACSFWVQEIPTGAFHYEKWWVWVRYDIPYPYILETLFHETIHLILTLFGASFEQNEKWDTLTWSICKWIRKNLHLNLYLPDRYYQNEE